MRSGVWSVGVEPVDCGRESIFRRIPRLPAPSQWPRGRRKPSPAEDPRAMSERVPMTRQGYDKLEADLRELKTVDRPGIVKEIEIARAHGDISENAEFHAAKER